MAPTLTASQDGAVRCNDDFCLVPRALFDEIAADAAAARRYAMLCGWPADESGLK